MDGISSTPFGVNSESFTNKNSTFIKNAAAMFKVSLLDQLLFAVKSIPGVPEVFNLLKLNTFKPKETTFFRDIILQTIRARRNTKERKNDLVDLMLDCMKDDSNVNNGDDETTDQYEKDMQLSNNKKSKHNLDEISVVATALVFLVAGYDTTGMTLSFLAYEMAKNPEVQKKLQEEIDQAFEESGGELPDYSVIQSLPYLDMVIHETLRVHSPVGVNSRVATKDYSLPGTDIVLKTGDMVSWNARTLHRNPEHWSNPTEFYPEHFSKEAKANRNP